MSWLALAGVMGTAFMAFALNREGLRRDRANADRYEEKAVALDQLSTRLDEVAGEIAAGRPEALTAFVDQVTAELETEHKQWLDGTKQVEAALASLDARLKELREARPEERTERRSSAKSMTWMSRPMSARNKATRLHRHALRQEEGGRWLRDRLRPRLCRADPAGGGGGRPDRASRRRRAAGRLDLMPTCSRSCCWPSWSWPT